MAILLINSNSISFIQTILTNLSIMVYNNVSKASSKKTSFELIESRQINGGGKTFSVNVDLCYNVDFYRPVVFSFYRVNEFV